MVMTDGQNGEDKMDRSERSGVCVRKKMREDQTKRNACCISKFPRTNKKKTNI